MHRRQFIAYGAAAAALPYTLLNLSRPAPANAGARASIVIVGGGFAGASAARLIKRLLPAAQVTLIEKQREYASAPYSHFVLTGLWQAAALQRDYRALQKDGIAVVHAMAQRIQERTVQLQDGSTMSFDRAIVAPGIGFDYSQIPGAEAAAVAAAFPHAYQGGQQIQLLARQLQQMPANGTVIIIPPPAPYRCSPAPYDRAGMIAAYLQQHKPAARVLILDQKEQFAQQTLFSDAWNRYHRERIEWLSGEGGGWVSRLDVNRREVYTEFGPERGDVINYIPPQRAAAVAARSGLTDASGWCPVNPANMESLQQPGVYVIGDAAALAPAPKSASCAMSQAHIAAAVIARTLDSAADVSAAEQLDSICFSHITPELAFSEESSYRLSVARVEPIQINLTRRDAPVTELSDIATSGIAWIQQALQQVFG